MQIFRGLDTLPALSKPTLTAIGNFDGVHLGHRKILSHTAAAARDKGYHSLALTFYPHPGQILGTKKLALIQTLDQRLAAIQKFGIDYAFVLTFDTGFAGLTGQEFIRTIIIEKLKAAEVVIGENFRFGKKKRCGLDDLKAMAGDWNFTVTAIPPVSKNGTSISSSLIRELLAAGNMEEANALLGSPYAIVGSIIPGSSRGRQLGFPTANIASPNDILPSGVFITAIDLDGETLPSVTNVGTRPTFDDGDTTIETHILDFEADIYRRTIQLSFLKRIREERKHLSPGDLSTQVRRDMDQARAFFNLNRSF